MTKQIFYNGNFKNDMLEESSNLIFFKLIKGKLAQCYGWKENEGII